MNVVFVLIYYYFCELIPKKEILLATEVIDSLIIEFENIKNDY